jgi:hypothetical protein
VLLRSEEKTDNTSVATFELAFTGDVIDLRRITRTASVEQMGMEAVPIDAREGAIGLKLAPLTLSARERMLSGGAKTTRNATERDRLALAYANAGRPTVAVMFNKPTVEAEAALPVEATSQPASGDTVNVVVGERVKVGEGGVSSGFAERVLDRELRSKSEERRQDAAIDMRVFEDKIGERLLQLGIQPRDISAAQVELSAKPEFKDKVWNDRELAYALGKQANAAIVISGIGRLVRTSADAPRRVVLTMRAYDVATGDIVGSTSVQRDLAAGGESMVQSIEDLSAEATAKLVTQMSDVWEAKPRK